MNKVSQQRGVLNGSFQVLHIHVLLVARLCACHMAQPGTDQNNGRVAFREAAHYADTATDLPVELFNDVIDMNAISIE